MLQLWGRKRWKIFDSPHEFPLEYLAPLRCERRGITRHRWSNQKGPEDSDGRALSDEFVLRGGDLLYLPRGYWHEAEAEPGHISCHLTVGIQSFTYADLLVTAIGRAATKDVNLRMPLPVAFGTEAEAGVLVREHVRGICESLPAKIDAETALAEVSEAFIRSRQPVESGLLRAGGSVDLDSRLRIREGLVCGISLRDSEVWLTFGAQTIMAPLAFEPALRYIAEARRFQPRWLPGGLTDEERLGLVRRLIDEGALVREDVRELITRDRAADLRSWLPVNLAMRRGEPQIEWREFGQELLWEPFFHQSAARAARAAGARPKITGPEPLLSLAEEVAPSGFVFHISRCGSTLVSNALRAVHGSIVISEAQPLGALLTPSVEYNPESEACFEEKRSELLKALIRAYGQRRRGDETALIIKFSSWNILSLPLVRRLWPRVPSVIVTRDPVEVMVSCLQRPPGWMRLRRDPNVAARVFGWSAEEIRTMSDERFCARALGRFLAVAAENVDGTCKVVDYSDLSAPGILDIAQFFGFADAEIDGYVGRCLATYSKDPASTRRFADDREEKQSAATPAVREESRRWAEDAWMRL